MGLYRFPTSFDRFLESSGLPLAPGSPGRPLEPPDLETNKKLPCISFGIPFHAQEPIKLSMYLSLDQSTLTNSLI